MPSLKSLETFYWVARLGSFHAAAARLLVTQPSVSYRIKDLETGLGRALFVRNGRALRLTGHGQALLQHAERMVLAAQELHEQFRSDGTIRGTLALGVTDAFATLCLPDLLRDISQRHPELDISVAVGNSHAINRKLDEGEVDVAVVSTPPQLASIQYEMLGRQTVIWMGGPSMRSRRTVDPAWISGERIFATPPPSNLDVITAQWFAAVGLPVPRLSICNSMSAIIGLVESDVGLGILPAALAEIGGREGKMHPLPTEPPLPPQEVFAAYSKGLLSDKLPVILDAIRAVVRLRNFCR